MHLPERSHHEIYKRDADWKKTKKKEETISKEEILAGIDAGLKDIKAKRTRPATELLQELRDEL